MRNFIYLFVAVLLWSCGNDAPKNEKIVVAGTIKNPTQKVIYFEFADVKDSAIVDDKGNFKININSSKELYASLIYDKNFQEIYLIPGDSLNIEMNLEPESMKVNFSGTGNIANNFITMRNEFNEKNKLSPYDVFVLEEKAFKLKLDSFFNASNDLLNQYIKKYENLSTQFIDFEKAKQMYDKQIMLLMYPSYYKHLTRNNDFKVDEKYYEFLSKVNLNDSNLIDIKEYHDFVRAYLDKKLNDAVEKDSTIESKYLLTAMNFTLKEITDVKVRNSMLYAYMNEHIKYEGINNTEEALKIFNENCTNPKLKDKIKIEHDKWLALAKGNVAPLFTYPDIKGKNISLADFKGKYVYIDVWATWCSPCKAEIPALEMLREKYKGKNIVFIGVSVDDTKEPWEKMVKEKQMKDYQLYAGGWKSSIAKDYKINSIPRFLLIDKEGKIIDANAERPSGKIDQIISQLDGI